MSKDETKSYGYEKRKLSSIAAPLDPDSDPEFNSGAYVYERKAKTLRQKSRPKNISLGTEGGQFYSVENRGKHTHRSRQDNPLLEFFGDELGLKSASEDDAENPVMEALHSGEDDHQSSGEEDLVTDRPSALRMLANFVKSPANYDPSASVTDDSSTESESDCGSSSQLTRRQLAASIRGEYPTKRQKLCVSGKVSDQSDGNSSESLTESESESEVLATAAFSPRPNFILSKEQRPLGPLVLDHRNHIVTPASINTYLREYQRDGIKFLWERYSEGRGGLLGDDMGLGKTIQVISFLSAIMRKYGDKRDFERRKKHVSNLQDGLKWKEQRALPTANSIWPTCLIIAPSTVVHNWKREFELWGYFEVGVYAGSPSQRETVLADFKMGRLDVVLTSFDHARREINIIYDLPWSCIIIDEVHHVKNPKSKVTEAFNQFVCQRRFGLTGTAIQNSYAELWTILDWTSPGRLGTSKQWKGFVTKPLTIGQSAGASEEEISKGQAVAMILKDRLLPIFFKRRTKDIIKDQLPTKVDEVVFCPLTPTQIRVYKRILDMEPVRNLIHKDDLCDCGSGRQWKECCHTIDKGDVLKYMSILIKISNHLALILPAPNDNPEQTVRHRELSEAAFDPDCIPKYGTAMLQPQLCGKWVVLDSLLKEWSKDQLNKVLIFTKSIKLLDMLEFHLKSNGYGFLTLGGSTKQVDRMPLIDRFQHDPHIFIFLISTLAGGTGLNLTAANKVVIFDPNWNPAHDLQAMDRAYRIGQTRDVFVYRLLGAGSIEELIYARQLYKQQQMAIGYQASVQTRYFQGVQGDTSRRGELFGIKNIFKLHEGALATKMAIERANIIELDWALAHLNVGKTKVAQKISTDNWAYEADAKGSKEEADLRGLGALLFDDDPPQLPHEDEVRKILNFIGVKYSHRNDDILLPSRIEEERSRKILQQKKRQGDETKKVKKLGGAGIASTQIESQQSWPPKRQHHITPPSPKSRLVSRQVALIELGMINDPTDLPNFAQAFGRQTGEEQSDILSRLDEYSRYNLPVS